MKILFFGDPHFYSQTTTSRIDDYRVTSLAKLKTLLDLAVEHDITDVMTTGDFFDKYEVSYAYLNDLVSLLTEFRDKGISVWSLIGNHDLPYNNMAYFKNAPLSLLFRSNLVKHIKEKNEFIDPILHKQINVFGIDFTKEAIVDSIKLDEGQTNILIMHYATENTVPGESIELKRISKFDFTISGHDHAYYPPLTLNNGNTIFRPGSLLRRTKDDYNLVRDIILYVFDSESNSMDAWVLPNTKKASEIFKNEIFGEQNLNLYDNKYNELFNKEYFESEANNILEILDVLPVTVAKESKEAVIDYLKESGVKLDKEV